MRIVPASVLAAALAAASLSAVQQQPPSDRPLAPHTEQVISDGAVLYRQHCAKCHGATGHGDGPAAAAMHFTPPDLTELAAKNHDMFPAARVAQIIEGRGPAVHGDRLMPVWGDVFTRTARGRDSARQRIDSLVRYLESIQRRPA